MLEGIAWYFPITALINAIASTLLGVYVFLINHKKKTVRFLFYFCLTVAFWSYGYFFWQISMTSEMALFWTRVLMLGAIFTSVLYYHLVLIFLGIEKEKTYKLTIIISYILAFIWSTANLTPLFVSGIERRMFFEFWPTPGILYIPFLLTFLAHFIVASILLIRNATRTEGVIKAQSILLAVGMLIGFIGGSTNYMLWYNIEIAPWGNGLVLLYVVLTAYAILKYKFLELKVISAEMFAGALFVIFLVEVFFSKNEWELFLRIGALLVVIAFGIMLVRSVRKEVNRREEIAMLAKSLEKANLRLKELDRQKTEFLSIASHQLRTPLSVISGYVELIEDGAYGKPTKGIKNVLDKMEQSNGHLVKLVDEFLNITRIEQGRTKYNYVKTDLKKMIKGVIDELKNKAADKEIKLSFRPSTKVNHNYKVDSEKIRHVIFNFVDNAIKYSEKGTIKIETSIERRGLVVRVIDRGLGFGKKDQANFFQKFYRGQNVEGVNVTGTGLGLYVCRKFMENHKGRIWAHSKGLKLGSEFGFWLPFSK